MDRMRKLIAKHMVDSKQTSPHCYEFCRSRCYEYGFMARKSKRKNLKKERNTKFTFTPMFIDCIVRVMKKYPIINSSVDGERIIIRKI
jgi:2-oxoglutarate dehydrogenase E2 component (dihydrolipoamide succinyltransferase)